MKLEKTIAEGINQILFSIAILLWSPVLNIFLILFIISCLTHKLFKGVFPLSGWFFLFFFFCCCCCCCYLFLTSVQFSSVQLLSCVWFFATLWIAARQASLSITNTQSSLKLMSIKSVMPSSHLILCRPFSSCPQCLPASGSFPMSQLFAWGGQSTGVSALALFLPKNIQDWSPSEWTGWISLQSKGLSRSFSNITVQKHRFFGAQLSSQSNSHIHTWTLKNHSLD